MSLTEDEKYAIMANVPYQIHEGVPIDVIEQELRLYGLDHEIDKELSDRVGVILHNDDEMIHAVRGTDFTNARDLISDLGLILGNPVFIKGAKTLALAESIPYALHSKYVDEYAFGEGVRNWGTTAEWKQLDDVRPLFYGRQFARKSAFPRGAGHSAVDSIENDIRENIYSAQLLKALLDIEREKGDPMAEQTLKAYQTEVEEMIENVDERRDALAEETKKQAGAIFKAVATPVATIEGLAKVGGSLPEYLRIQPERERLQKALDKHPNKTPSLTGHSLGSVVNVLGRENDIKTISFNPAPQGGDGFKGHHPDSKVYRILGDIVSYKGFRTPEDTEPVTEFKPKYGSSFLDYHRVNQFIPEKPKIQIEKVLYSPFNYRPVKYDNKRVSQVFDYCKEFPYLQVCSGRREKVYY